MPRVAVAMSGGVDSSVAALLSIRAGYDVTGVTMTLGRGVGDPTDAARVCHALGIEHAVISLEEAFERLVIGPFARAYADGLTPNPCVTCNPTVKFGLLQEAALAGGAELFATGHHARIRLVSSVGASVSGTDSTGVPIRRPTLLRGRDPSKDQSYFLYRLPPAVLTRTLFPVGDLTKGEVRALAAEAALPVHDKPESQEACFAQGERYTAIVRHRHPDAFESGDIIDRHGIRLGRHRGIAQYTIGQRKGLGLGGPDPSYVTAIDPGANTITVGTSDDLLVTSIAASSIVWHAPTVEGRGTFRYRHGGREHAGQFSTDDDRLLVDLDEPAIAVAPGQALVCYKGDAVLGGGTIEEAR